MPKYMIHASYTVAGVKGLQAKGGSSRRDAIAEMLEGLGGSLESMYFAFGDTDVVERGPGAHRSTLCDLGTSKDEHRLRLYNRLTFVAEQGRIVEVFYPLFPPDRNAREVLASLEARAD